MSRFQRFAGPLAAMTVLSVMIPWTQAEITNPQRLELESIRLLVTRAGKSYTAGKYEESGKQVDQAQERLGKLVTGGDIDLYRKAESLYGRIAQAHALLELEGVRLAPYFKPPEPKPMADKPSDKPDASKPAVPGAPAEAGGISFVKNVAPILVKNCGRCHVTGNRGDFSMSDYATLMKGPAVGVVVVPGNSAGSRLIDVIKDGAMPPNGGGIPAADLQTLTAWVQAGAKCDAPSPDAQLTSFVAGNAQAMDRTPAPEIKQATGRETVSFAKDVAPILVDNCNGCHLDAQRIQGGLRMDTFAQFNRGGDSGAVVMPGDADASLLIKHLKGDGVNRMPAGGRPPLNDKQIQLISTWIKEGATLDGRSSDQPLKVMSALAWARDASHDEMMKRRVELADANWLKGSPGEEPATIETDNFYVVGSVGPKTLAAVAKQAESALGNAMSVVTRSAKGGKSAFKGRATIFVFPRRYDYSEFGRMVEQRSLPKSWTSHWRHDGLDAYVGLVVSSNDDDDQIRDALVGPLTSLLVADSGDVPSWISEGVGRAATEKFTDRKNPTVQRWNEQLPAALAAFTKPDQLLKKTLPPDQADVVAFAIGKWMIGSSSKGKFDKMLGQMNKGDSFNTAFVNAYAGQPADFLTNFIRWSQMKKR